MGANIANEVADGAQACAGAGEYVVKACMQRSQGTPSHG
eukprot:gene16223-21072_t